LQRKQFLGILLFAIGSSFTLGLYFVGVLLVEPFLSQSGLPGLLEQNLPNAIIELFTLFGLAIIPFFLIALGLYFIFQPMFNSASGTVASRERKEELLEFQSSEAGRFKGMSNDELQKELVRMKTIEHVLLARENSRSNSKPDDMSQTLANAQNRIAAIEEEISMRQAAQNLPRMRPTQPSES
jgi:hypothetical protein